MSLPEWISHHYVKIQGFLAFVGLVVAWSILKGPKREHQIRVREADRTDLNRLKQGPDLAQAKLNSKARTPPPSPLSLPGIRLVGEAHEILGVDLNASEAEVMKAYKEGMKRFHPDRIQGQAKDQIQFYVEASAKLNQAKEELLKKLRTERS